MESKAPPAPWLASDDAADDPRRHAPATSRNREAITEQLTHILPETGSVLELASGSGEHIVHFARHFPQLHWQPSDTEDAALASITAHSLDAGLPNIAPPLLIDAAQPDWPIDHADALLCINMVHISPWAATEGLFRGAGKLMPSGAPLILYGPFLEAEVVTAESNMAFDASLKARNPAWGLRDRAAVDALAACHGLRPARRVAMPANNILLVYRRD